MQQNGRNFFATSVTNKEGKPESEIWPEQEKKDHLTGMLVGQPITKPKEDITMATIITLTDFEYSYDLEKWMPVTLDVSFVKSALPTYMRFRHSKGELITIKFDSGREYKFPDTGMLLFKDGMIHLMARPEDVPKD
jgi:hypothetical protein